MAVSFQLVHMLAIISPCQEWGTRGKPQPISCGTHSHTYPLHFIRKAAFNLLWYGGDMGAPFLVLLALALLPDWLMMCLSGTLCTRPLTRDLGQEASKTCRTSIGISQMSHGHVPAAVQGADPALSSAAFGGPLSSRMSSCHWLHDWLEQGK